MSPPPSTKTMGQNQRQPGYSRFLAEDAHTSCSSSSSSINPTSTFAQAFSCYENIPSWKKSVSMGVRYLPHFQTVILHLSQAQPSVRTASYLISTSPAALQIQLLHHLTEQPQNSKCSISNPSTTHWLTHLSARDLRRITGPVQEQQTPHPPSAVCRLEKTFFSAGPKKPNLKTLRFLHLQNF